MKLNRKKELGDFSKECPWMEREWLETDGSGGYASLSIPLCATRKYHAFLSVPLDGFEGRYVLLNGFEISVADKNGKKYRLDTNQYPGNIHPRGYVYLEEFEKNIFPHWSFQAGDLCNVDLEIFMRRDERGAVYFAIENCNGKNSDDFTITLSPVISYRNSHYLTCENYDLNFTTEKKEESYQMDFYQDMPPLYFSISTESQFTNAGAWLRNKEYYREMERGFDFNEDNFIPGRFTFKIKAGGKVFVRTALSLPDSTAPAFFKKIYNSEKVKREKEAKVFEKPEDPIEIKILKAESINFLVKNREGASSIIAGYPWFGEWGRDTMISLPGITVCCGRVKEAIDILEGYASYIKNGLIPNTLGGSQGFESYNSIDAGLLYIMAAQYLWINGESKAGNVRDKMKKWIIPAVAEIVKAYLEERVPDLTIEDRGFPVAGSWSTQLTWMDAIAWGKPVTPRNGSPVEITALFYNGLKFYLELLEQGIIKVKTVGEEKKIAEAAKNIENNFCKSYWIEDGTDGWLADVVRHDGRDEAIRPNMLFAASLPYPLLNKEKALLMVETVEKELLTWAGLRTLSPKDSRFCAKYEGDGNSRDSCYHQGTVWPWLLGIYTSAALYAAGEKGQKAKGEEIKALILAFLQKHLDNYGMGFVSEVFDGLKPEEGKGTYAQAWSSAEIIKAWQECSKAVDF